MILAFNIADIIQVPFGYLLDFLYQFTTNYGVALILFAILVKIILLPTTMKSKKSTMKMSRLAPRVQEIQKKYADDPQKQNMMTQQLYKEEGVSMGGGCLWSLLPLLILLPLYTVVRQPITYILHETAEVSAQIVEVLKGLNEAAFSGNDFYNELVAASLLHNPEVAAQALEQIKGIVAHPATLNGLDFSFLGVNLGAVPQFNIFAADWVWDWAHIGAFLMPLLSAGSQVLSMFISQNMNNSVVTNEKGVQDKETAKKSQANQSGKIMMWMMPIMSLWIGFTVPAALSIYWLIQGVVSTFVDVILTKHYRKVYDAEDAIRLQKAMEQEALEAEKERQRAERRAANPDGITTNTSKKKLQQKQQREQEAAKAAAKKEYDAKHGIVEEEKEEKTVLSGIPSRPYAKGRAYDPNRYKTENTEE